MARYRKVDVGVWDDEHFQQLSPIVPSGQGLWLYLLTNRHTTNIAGLYRAGEGALSEDLRWPLEGFREAFREVFREGLAEADWHSRLVWLPRGMKYDPPQSPNVVKSWKVPWNEIPDCALKRKAYQRFKAFMEALGPAFLKAFLETCREPLAKPSPNPDPDPDPEPEQEKEECSEGSAPSLPPSEPLSLIPEDAPPKALMVFPTVRGLRSNGATWKLTPREVKLFREAFPDLDVLAECKKALLWVEANTAKRKTADGMLSFLNRWLSKAQNSPRSGRRNGGPPEPAYDDIA